MQQHQKRGHEEEADVLEDTIQLRREQRRQRRLQRTLV
jgi:hypothetical protein